MFVCLYIYLLDERGNVPGDQLAVHSSGREGSEARGLTVEALDARDCVLVFGGKSGLVGCRAQVNLLLPHRHCATTTCGSLFLLVDGLHKENAESKYKKKIRSLLMGLLA